LWIHIRGAEDTVTSTTLIPTLQWEKKNSQLIKIEAELIEQLRVNLG
jgi:hypothetical protein